MPVLQIISATTSGHTDYVVEVLQRSFASSGSDVAIVVTRAEQATEADMLNGDFLLLASSTWNTGGREGQLNPHMFELLKKTVAGIDLAGKEVSFIALGDERYRYRANALTHMREFVQTHGGTEVAIDPLLIINEPYGQESAIEQWAASLHQLLKAV